MSNTLQPIHINDEVFLKTVINDPSIQVNWGDANTWPTQHGDADPSIATRRPDWRYPNRADFFELKLTSIKNIDWHNREIDRHAERADGLYVTVAMKMTMVERIIYNPRFSWLKYQIDCLIYRWNNRSEE